MLTCIEHHDEKGAIVPNGLPKEALRVHCGVLFAQIAGMQPSRWVRPHRVPASQKETCLVLRARRLREQQNGPNGNGTVEGIGNPGVTTPGVELNGDEILRPRQTRPLARTHWCPIQNTTVLQETFNTILDQMRTTQEIIILLILLSLPWQLNQ